MDIELREILTAVLLNLDPRIGDKRSVLKSLLLEISLYNLKYPSTKEQISKEIDKIINQTDFLTDIDLDRAIQECKNRFYIRENSGLYELASHRKTAFENAYTEAENSKLMVEKGIIHQIELEVGETINDEVQKKITSIIEFVLTENVYENSLSLSSQNLSFEELIEIIQNSEPAELIKKNIIEILPDQRELYQHKVLGGINLYFANMPPELKKYLNLINNTIVINQILSADPTIAQKQLQWFSHRRVYLDTNVVLAYLFEGQKCHKSTIEVINASKKIGVNLFISPETLNELEKQVVRAKHNHVLVENQKVSPHLAVQGDDAILATYLQKKFHQPSLSWNVFIATYESFEQTLLENDIIVEVEEMENASSFPSYPDIKKIVSDCKPSFVSENVVNHDALNSALVLLLRNKYPRDERGELIWLLTLDNSLIRAQRILRKNGIVKSLFSTHIADWGEIVLPVQSLLGLDFQNFVSYLAQARFGVLSDPEIIQMDFLETITDSDLDIEHIQKLEPEHQKRVFIKLQQDREVRSYLVKDKKPQLEETKKDVNLKINQVIEGTDEVTIQKDLYDKQMAVLTNSIEQKDKQIIELEKRVKTMESSLLTAVIRFIKNLFYKITHIAK